MTNKKILIVDNDPQFVQAASRALGNGHVVITASSKHEAVQKAKEELPDAIIAGFVDSQGGAFQACRELRRIPGAGAIPILIVDVKLKEYTRKGWKRQEVVETEPAGYLVRPVGPDELNREIEAVLNGGPGPLTDQNRLMSQMEDVLKKVKEVEKILTEC